MKNNNEKTDLHGAKVISITRDAKKFRAVMLRKEAENYQLLWTKSSDTGQVDWRKFAAECISSESKTENKIDSNSLVIGFDGSTVVFHSLNMPAVKHQEIDNIVRLQIEARLPIPTNQVELDWSEGITSNGQVDVIVAAARKEQLQKFVESTHRVKPKEILLDNEAIVESWSQFFYGSDQSVLIVNIGESDTKICAAENGRLINSASLDVTITDFLAGEDLARQSEAIERFAQDIRNLLNSFGYTKPIDTPIFVLSNGSKIIEQVVSCLNNMGLDIRTALPNLQKIRTVETLAAAKIDEIYEYRVAIGLASMALKKDKKPLNLFQNLYRPSGKEKEKRLWRNPKAMGLFASVMLILLIAVFYMMDIASFKAIEKSLERQDSQASFKLLSEKQELIKKVAGNRPDLLNLLSQLSPDQAEGIRLDSFNFKKGKSGNIKGLADSSDQLYKFQKTLLDKKDISDVKIQSVSKESKGNKLKFTITFSYKHFSKRSR